MAIAAMTRPPRIARTVPKSKRLPDALARRSKSHLAFIRLLPCVACGHSAPSEAAHVRCGTDGGAALKPSDRYAVPLCTWCHTLGPYAQHVIGELTFWANLKIDPWSAAGALWTHSGDIEAGERIVFRARQAIGLKV